MGGPGAPGAALRGPRRGRVNVAACGSPSTPTTGSRRTSWPPRPSLGEPLTAASYDAWQRAHDAASPALLIRRFGSWKQACAQAGLASNKTRSTTRRWSDEDVVAIVADYLAAPGSTGSLRGLHRLGA
ncbi:hypothetical protein G5V59_08030 [Nocardioides sp. W3-2-3]|nr:hypothetical protein [Nocardioides convexus]NHA00124.1 hypothetical protein [Nocardioides convexus]